MVTPTREQVAQVAYEAGFISTPSKTSEQEESVLNQILKSFKFLGSSYSGMVVLGDENLRRNVAQQMNLAINAEPADRDHIVKNIKDQYLGLDIF